MTSISARRRTLEQIQQSPFAEPLEWSYPASPPLGFPPPHVAQGRTKEVLVWSENQSEYSTCTVLEKRGSEVAYELPGGFLHTTACGEIRLCHIVQKQYDLTASFKEIMYVRTTKRVAIKMDLRAEMRHLHDDEDRRDHKHHPFPENPWKEVSALQLIHDRIGTSEHDTKVVSLIDALCDDEYLYEILPYYPKSLYWVIHREHPGGMDEATARHFFTQLLEAIQTVHACGICHRDISSHNLMVEYDEHDNHKLVLIDFGMCVSVPYNYPDDHFTEDVTEVSHLSIRRRIHCQTHCGKLRFMAPEIYARQDFDGLAVDLWSAAVVLFEMITGKLPYQKPCESDDGYHDLTDEHFYWNGTKSAAAAANVNVNVNNQRMLSWGRPISDDLVHLLHDMFRPNPKDRLSLAQIAAHPWLLQ